MTFIAVAIKAAERAPLPDAVTRAGSVGSWRDRAGVSPRIAPPIARSRARCRGGGSPNTPKPPTTSITNSPRRFSDTRSAPDENTPAVFTRTAWSVAGLSGLVALQFTNAYAKIAARAGR
jgi:hypothetical protein